MERGAAQEVPRRTGRYVVLVGGESNVFGTEKRRNHTVHYDLRKSFTARIVVPRPHGSTERYVCLSVSPSLCLSHGAAS